MELLYIWIEEYECFKETEFNFSDKFKFCYRPKEVTLICNKGMNSSLGFWGEQITNLSVIVGDNGAGKTTLLKRIIDCISYEGNYLEKSCFFVFFDKESSNIKIFVNGNFIHKLHIENNIIDLGEPEIFPYSYMNTIGNERDKGNSVPELLKNKLIYLQNVLDINDYLHEKNGQIYDFSIGGLIRHDYKNNVESGHIELSSDKLVNFFNNEIYRQLDFVQSYKTNNSENILPFEMPNKLQVSFVDNKHYMKDICEQLKRYADIESENLTPYKQNFYKKVDKLVYMINEKLHQNSKQTWCDLMVNSLVLNVIKEIAMSPIVPERREVELFSFFKAYETLNENENEDILSFCTSFFNEVEKDLSRKNSLYAERLEPYKDFVEWLNRNYERLNLYFSKTELGLINHLSFSIQMEKNNREIFEEFFVFYRRTCTSFYYLNFSWGLSSGENNLLSLYARLYSALKSKIDGSRGVEVVNNFSIGETKCNNILLLIDEADLSYHPEWQRLFIHSLILFLPSIFKDCDLQIILTTHSPIILSDVPKSNVIYLQQRKNDSKNLHKETFGQNIYTLFNDAFFLKESEEKFVLGKFAEEKIRKASKFLESIIVEKSNLNIFKYNDLEMDDAKRIISFIGEPIIKSALQEKLKKASDILQENNSKSEELSEIIGKYDKLSYEEQKELIKYIVQKEV
ncbi:AAA family ATPase [Clostridium estertheticum]|uniref:AAA family ATPase n=1 Tax=Clostridium estertheticum TaxID=238834 RepID=UPI0013E95839|nr:AAA family ATPase [Clostridium estertheticum]MBZ9688284.1 AAA family ATPase [Clostridium estertheticum]